MRILPKRVFRTLAITMITLAALVLDTAVVPSLAAAQPVPQLSSLTNIRVGRHATFDRVVLDLTGPAPQTSHVTRPSHLTADPSGKRISLPGNRFLNVATQQAQASAYQGRRKFSTPQLRNVRAVTITGDFEGVLSIGLGLRHQTWTHVFTLTNPTRLVIDVGR